MLLEIRRAIETEVEVGNGEFVHVEQMAHMILELKAHGVSILLSEQNMHFAELVSDRAYVLEKGQIRFEGSMAELAANEQVRRSYLSV